MSDDAAFRCIKVGMRRLSLHCMQAVARKRAKCTGRLIPQDLTSVMAQSCDRDGFWRGLILNLERDRAADHERMGMCVGCDRVARWRCSSDEAAHSTGKIVNRAWVAEDD